MKPLREQHSWFRQLTPLTLITNSTHIASESPSKREVPSVARDRIVRLQIMLDDEEMRVIENWRFSKRMPSRAAAVRELLRRGLAAEGFKLANAGESSDNYGVVHTPASNEDA